MLAARRGPHHRDAARRCVGGPSPCASDGAHPMRRTRAQARDTLAGMSVDPTVPAGGERPPRPSATLVVVRDGERGLEVLLSRRAERGDHNSGAWVFPGGLLDAGDRSAHGCCAGLDDAGASARLGVEAHGLDYYVAAVRECFEESGLLFALDAKGALLELDAGLAERIAPWRGALHRGERTLL